MKAGSETSRVLIPGSARTGMSAASFVLGSVLWALVLALVFYLYLFRGKPDGADGADGHGHRALCGQGACPAQWPKKQRPQ